MSQGVNKVFLVGRVGQDPKMASSQSGEVANLSIATSESWKDKTTGERTEKTEWHNVVFFGKLAEIVREYVHKGSLIYVEGKLATTKYQDKETGMDKYSTKVMANTLQMLSSKKDESEGSSVKTEKEVDKYGDLDQTIPF